MVSFTDFRDKVAVVTGAAQGMGLGIARRLRQAGAHVVIADIEQAVLSRTAAEFDLVGVVTDVRDPRSVEALAQAAMDRFGKVDILVNNAGVGPMGRIADMSLDDWRWVLDINLSGVIHGVHAFLPILRANSGGGYIVNTASLSGVCTAPTTAAYSVSKFGVVALSEVLAQELEAEGSSIGVSVLLPGPTRSAIGSSSRNRPQGETQGLKDVRMEDLGLFEQIPWKDPLEIGDIVIDAMARGELHVFTHDVMIDMVRARHRAIEAAADRAIAGFEAAARAAQA